MLDLKSKSMFLDLFEFDRMFPCYTGIPMWSSWKTEGKETVLKVAIPGYDKEDFQLYVEGDSLHLKIKEGTHYSIVERHYYSDYNLEKAKAEYKNGVLIIRIPKTTSEKTKKMIEVS